MVSINSIKNISTISILKARKAEINFILSSFDEIEELPEHLRLYKEYLTAELTICSIVDSQEVDLDKFNQDFENFNEFGMELMDYSEDNSKSGPHRNLCEQIQSKYNIYSNLFPQQNEDGEFVINNENLLDDEIDDDDDFEDDEVVVEYNGNNLQEVVGMIQHRLLLRVEPNGGQHRVLGLILTHRQFMEFRGMPAAHRRQLNVLRREHVREDLSAEEFLRILNHENRDDFTDEMNFAGELYNRVCLNAEYNVQFVVDEVFTRGANSARFDGNSWHLI